MDKIIDVLKKCILFKNVKEEDLIDITLKKIYQVQNFSKGQSVALEDDDCTSIGVLVEGNLEAQKLYANGKTLTIDTLEPGDIFGEVIIFSSMNKYPLSFISINNSKIMFIPKNNIIKLCSTNPEILNNFMGALSNKILMLNKKLKNLSYQTLRQKLANYILDLNSKQQSLTIKLPHSRIEMSEQLGVQRPSLSRELINMRDEGIIDFDKNIINILDREALENVF